jgi:hypothetical protein
MNFKSSFYDCAAVDDTMCRDFKSTDDCVNDSSEVDASEINEESALVAAPNDYGFVIFRCAFF